MKKKLSIIIVAYKNLEIIKNCIESIIKFNDIGEYLEIVVVDNTPEEDHIFNYISKNYTEVKCIKNENKGFGQGNNIGVQNSSGKYLLFLNPDTILIEPIMDFAIKKFGKDKNLSMFGVKLIDCNKRNNMSYFFIDKSGFIYNQIIKIYNKMNYFNGSEMFICGANIFIRRDVFIGAGMFDENIFMYGEEADLTRRILQYNINSKIKFYKEKKIIHLEGGTTEVKDLATRQRIESRIYCAQKFGIDYKKKTIKEIKYLNFKKNIYQVMGKKSEKENIEKTIKTIEEFLLEN